MLKKRSLIHPHVELNDLGHEPEDEITPKHLATIKASRNGYWALPKRLRSKKTATPKRFHSVTEKKPTGSKKRSKWGRRSKSPHRDAEPTNDYSILTPRRAPVFVEASCSLGEDDEDGEFISWRKASYKGVVSSRDTPLQLPTIVPSVRSPRRCRSPSRRFNRGSRLGDLSMSPKPNRLDPARALVEGAEFDVSFSFGASEELATISELSTKKQSSTASCQSPIRAKPRRSVSPMRIFSKSENAFDSTSLGTPTNLSTKSDELRPSGLSLISSDSSTLNAASSGSYSGKSPPRHQKQCRRASSGSLSSFLENPWEHRQRRTSTITDVKSVSSSSKGSQKGYISSFLGSRNGDQDTEELSSSVTCAQRQYEGGASIEDHFHHIDNQSHASSSIVSRGLNALEKIYEDCT